MPALHPRRPPLQISEGRMAMTQPMSKRRVCVLESAAGINREAPRSTIRAQSDRFLTPHSGAHAPTPRVRPDIDLPANGSGRRYTSASRPLRGFGLRIGFLIRRAEIQGAIAMTSDNS